MKLTTKIFIGLALGAIVGLALHIAAPDLFGTLDTYVFSPLGTVFLNLIKMLVVPIVFFSITLGTASLGDPKKLGRIGGKTIGFFLITTTIAIAIAIGLAYLFQPGNIDINTAGAEYESQEAPSVVETFTSIIPTNPIQSMVEGNMLQIIAFSIFIGFALAMLGKKTEGVLKVIEQGNEIMMYLVNLIMRFAPYGAFGLLASAIGTMGIDGMKAMAMYMFVVILALFIHGLVTYGGAVKFLGKMSPIKFFKGFFPAMTVGFSTSSSSSTLPISMKTAQENLNVPKPVSSFVQPLGATINMDGTAIMQGVATIFIAQVYATDLSFGQLIMVVLVAVLASIGTAGVPGVGLIMLAMVLNQVSLPVEGIALIIGIDRLLDMTRTALNITGDAACAVVVAESEKKHGIEEEPVRAVEA
ncbi:dicarboxylate/amino acid:cation symporter [Halobacillus sp. ACCC02827]|uniref:dicarboxylate/amino acid:cation symporter n=1 Tax=Bacillaceae TaxID=186817 RepID=UPI0002A4EA1C|nr:MULTISPECIES: dicarboxylate/amino acid:cation symporter [Bacillaceae]ELK46676.1 dicarboxylate/amino acid/cation symporter (DAACS) family protein [Halobacillus sp. BAB-2008]QHT45312.1 dicarboxylate/amino acid:cation symporter [Bacillus sp. SB49]WJE16095.1 dicarboxylate/amino acid:cation symporter [Halobacillus sp. ACCC02827]